MCPHTWHVTDMFLLCREARSLRACQHHKFLGSRFSCQHRSSRLLEGEVAERPLIVQRASEAEGVYLSSVGMWGVGGQHSSITSSAASHSSVVMGRGGSARMCTHACTHSHTHTHLSRSSLMAPQSGDVEPMQTALINYAANFAHWKRTAEAYHAAASQRIGL